MTKEQDGNRSLSVDRLVPLLALFLFLFASSAWVTVRLSGAAADDAYIHRRIADNLLHTGHAYFNSGELVMATSSPLWTVVLAFSGLSALSPPHFAFWEAALVALAGTAAFWIGLTAWSSIGRWRWLLATIACCAVWSALIDSAVEQMETPLAVCLLLLAATALIDNSEWCLPLLALAACTRLEIFLLLACALTVSVMLKRARRPGFACALIIAFGLFGTLWLHFRTLLPNSIRAKTTGYAPERIGVFREIVPPQINHPYLAAGLVLLVLALSIWIVQDLISTGRRLRPVQIACAVLALWGVLLPSVYVITPTLIFAWYFPLIWVPLLLGLLLYVPPAYPRIRVPLHWLIAVLAVVPLLTSARRTVADTIIRRNARPAYDRDAADRVREYLAIGAALRRTCPTGRLMTSEIGALSYSFGGYVYDAFGIASPGALKYQPLPRMQDRGGIPAAFVLETKPDIVVSFDVLAATVLADTTLERDYQDLVLPPVLPSDQISPGQAYWHHAHAMHVLLRRNGVCPEPQTSDALQALFIP